MLAVLSVQEFFAKLTDPLVLFGLGGQMFFMLRFVVQWLVSERKGRSTVPIAFWYISCMGGMTLFAYALLNEDPVIMLGQSLGLAIYVRNLVLIYRDRGRLRRLKSQEGRAAAGPPGGHA